MLNSKPVTQIRFLDIETVPQYENIDDMPERKKNLFLEKFSKDISLLKSDEEISNFYTKQASFYPEFGKIVCISLGKIMSSETDSHTIKVASFTGDDDKSILINFIKAMPDIKSCEDTNKATIHLCAHYGKVFDFPYISKRLLLNSLPLPAMFDYGHLKPWELNYFVDTIDAWRFGRMDVNASLDLLADSFGLDSPKSDMSGKDVKDVYYKEKNLEKIADYCEQDVTALIGVYLRMKGDFRELIKSK